MKRSNLFLAATTGLLAIASIAFAKSKDAKNTIPGFCSNGAGHACPTQATLLAYTLTSNGFPAAKCSDQRTVVTQDNCVIKLGKGSD